MAESPGGQPERRWPTLQAAWPHILEPVGLEEITTPCLAGASSPTSRRYLNGELVAEQRTEALALMRLPATTPSPTPIQKSLPQPHLAWVLMRGADTLAAFSSQISSLPPAIAASGRATGRLRLAITEGSLSTTANTEVRGDAHGWISEPVPIPEALLGGAVALVVFGAQWPAPGELEMRVSTELDSYLDGFVRRLA